MKTTIDLDEGKLRRIMTLTGIKTRKEAVDHALTEAERLARLNALFARRWSAQDLTAAVEPDYNPLKLREQEKRRHAAG
jgi:Arc/MetJ family transcription regulator